MSRPAGRGVTAIELVVVCAIMGVFCAVAVPSAVGTRRALGVDAGARHLTLLLREAQARAQSTGARTAVEVAPDGAYVVVESSPDGWRTTARGVLPSAVATNYPLGRVEFAPAGWPLLAGTATPRAGSFVLGKDGHTRTIVLQLTGCVRCR